MTLTWFATLTTKEDRVAVAFNGNWPIKNTEHECHFQYESVHSLFVALFFDWNDPNELILNKISKLQNLTSTLRGSPEAESWYNQRRTDEEPSKSTYYGGFEWGKNNTAWE